MFERHDLTPRLQRFYERGPIGRALTMRALLLANRVGLGLLLGSIYMLFTSHSDANGLFWGSVVLGASVIAGISGLTLAVGLRMGRWSQWLALDLERAWLKRHAKRIDGLLAPNEMIHHVSVGHVAKTLRDRRGDMLILVTSMGLRVLRVAWLGSGLIPIVTSAHQKLHRPQVKGPSLVRSLRLILNPEKGVSIVHIGQVLGPPIELRLASQAEAELVAESLSRLHKDIEAGPGALALIEPEKAGGELAIANEGGALALAAKPER